MWNNLYPSVGGLVLSSMVALSLLTIAYLARLKFQELRRKRDMARKGVRYGLIQTIRAMKRPAAIRSGAARAITPAQQDPTAVVPAEDTGSKRWTSPGPSPAISFQWN